MADCFVNMTWPGSTHQDQHILGNEILEQFVDPISLPQENAIDPDLWVDSYGDYLFRYAFSRLRDANAVEEVVQETFLAGIRYREQFSGRGPERAWLLGILKRKIVDYIRLRTKFDRAASYEDEHDLSNRLFDEKGNWRQGAVPWSTTVDQHVSSRELWGIVQNCLGHLPIGQSDVFVLSVMEEMDADQICRELEITPASFWTRMHRARIALSKCVGSQWFSDGEGPKHAE